MLNDLGLNLVSEFIGILVTVFLVDRALKIREDRQFQPTKDIIYAKLTRQLYKFLMLVAPVKLKKELETEYGPNHYYYYGNVLCPISSLFQKEDYSFLQGYYQRSEIKHLNGLYSGVEQLRADLERIIDISAFLRDPLLLKDSYELLENLNDIMKLSIKPAADPKEVEIEVLSYSVALAKSVEKAIKLMDTLLTKARIKKL